MSTYLVSTDTIEDGFVNISEQFGFVESRITFLEV
jgi:hypothetical protein